MTEQALSPLRRRMIEDMMIRKFAQKTQHDYVQRVKDFANFLDRFPDTAKTEDEITLCSPSLDHPDQLQHQISEQRERRDHSYAGTQDRIPNPRCR